MKEDIDYAYLNGSEIKALQNMPLSDAEFWQVYAQESDEALAGFIASGVTATADPEPSQPER